MAILNPGRQRKWLQRAAMRGAGRMRPEPSPTLRVEGLESRVMLAAAPVITAPQIFGVRPGSPFLFDVTASGDRPMTFSATGLPTGLALNPQTGVITGSLANYATYDLTLTATNPSGSDTENFRIVVGDKIGLTPAMGWNSWTIFPGSITQSIVQAQAAAIASSGLINYGWSYVNMDAGWEGGRTAPGQPIQGNSSFPNMQAMADYIHSLNLKFGVYTVPQDVGYVGELAGSTGNNLWADAQQFATWGVDYLKYDGDPPSQADIMQAAQALKASGRDVWLSLSSFAGLSPNAAGFYSTWATSFRTGSDITDAFLNVLNDGITYMQPWLNTTGPGHWSDADNLELGWVNDQNGQHPTMLTPSQQQSQVSIWAMDAAPLMLGNDLTKLDAATLALLTNEEVIAIDQDPLGMPSRPVNGNTMIQSRPLADGSTAVELINVSNSSSNITINFSDLGLSGSQIVHNVWQKQDVGTYSGSFTATIPSNGTALITVRPASAGAPQILSQPVNQFTDLGKPATFSIAATGAGTLSYQWTKNGAVILGANSATYTTPATTSADNGAVFHCIVTNSVGQITSYEADLGVRGTTNYLSDSRYFYGTTGYYSIQMDASVLGTTMNINGVSFAKGIGTHSPSEIDYFLNGQGGTFQAQVGLDNNQPGLAIFQVFLDGVKVYDSGVLTAGMDAVPINVDVRGARVLQLVVANGGPNNNYDQADWANARLTTALVPLQLPTVTSFSRNVTFATPLTFSTADFTAAFTDLTAGQILQNIKITALPAHGTLRLNGTAVIAGQNIASAQISNLAYTPNAGYYGSDTFGWNATDQLGYALLPATVNLTIQAPPPPTAPPNAPIVAAATASTSSLFLSWTDSSLVPNVATGYAILASTDGVHFNQIATASAGTTSMTITGLAAGTTYFYEVVGSNTLGNSLVSNSASAITITPPINPTAPSTSFDLSGGFAANSPLTYNGSTRLVNNFVSITNNQPSQQGSVYYNTPQSVTNFTTQFDYQISGTWPLGDGFTFVIQNTGLNALGQGGGGLGYGASSANGSGGIAKSIAIKFDVFSNEGEGTNSTGLYINGAAPTAAGAIDLTSTGFNMRSYDLSRATISYDGTTLTVVLKDLVSGATATQHYTVNIPAIIGGTQAWVGFTGAAGSIYAYQSIMNWKYAASAPAASAPGVPTGLTAIPVGNSAAVSWTAASSASTYTLKYSTTSGGPYTTVNNISGTAYTLPGLASGATYYFLLSASNVNGTGADSPPISATLVPAAPTGLTGTPSNGQVTLNWTGSSGATSYTVKYSNTSGGPYTAVPGVSGTSTTITGLTNGTTYYFAVSATNAGGEGANSAETSAKPVLPIPAAPIGLNATPGNGQVALTWNAATFAATYTIKYGTTSGSYTNSVTGISGTGATVTGLLPGTTYYFVVSATNMSGESPNSAQSSATLVPAAPTIFSVTPGNGQAVVNWTAMTGATSYTVKYSTTNGGPYSTTITNIAGTSKTITGLTAGTTYYFVVSASNATGESANSAQAAATLVPPTPSGLVATPGNGQVALTWNAALGAASYTIKYSTTNGGPYTTTVANLTGTSTTVTGLTPGAAYYFVISATDAAGESPNSSQTSALLAPSSPSTLNAIPGNAQVALSWSPTLGAATYTLKYTTSSGGPYTTTVANILGTSSTITGLAAGTTYYFVVSATNATGESANSAQTGATVTPPAPSGLGVTPGNGQATVSWNAALGAASYTIKYSTTSGGPYTTTVANIVGTSSTVTGLTPGATYYFVVSATNPAGESGNSSQTSALLAPPATSGLIATPGNGQVALTWSPTFGATSYTVKYSTTNGGPYTTTVTSLTNNSTLTGLAAGTTYYFVVSASNATGEGANSTQAAATLVPPTPAGLIATSGNGQVALTWNAALGAASYTVKYSTTNGGPYTSTVTNVAVTSTTVTGLAPGTTYYFVISATNPAGESANSAQSSATLAPAAPSGLNAIAGNAQASLTWNAVAGATSYTVKYTTTSGGPYTLTLPAGTNSATVTGLTNGTPYYFVVTASNAGGESAASAQASALPQVPAPSAPTSLSATPGDAQVALTWNAVVGATSYTLKYATTSGGPYTLTLPAGTNSATVTGLANGTTYYFIVTASNPGGESANSNQASAAPALPVPGAPTGLNATPGNAQVALSWNAVAGATGYTVKYATTSGGPYTLTLPASGTSATVTGLANGTAYYFVVSATNPGGQSANSLQTSAAPVQPAPLAPTGLVATPANGQITLTWNAATTATSYTLKYSTTNGGPYTTTLANIAGTSTTISGLTNGTAYFFVVSASNSGGESLNSAQSTATPVTSAPATPTGLAATPGNGLVALTWNAALGATSYNVKYATTSGGPYTTFNIAGTSLNVAGLTNGTLYYFTIAALNAGGESANATAISATPSAPLPPAAPTGLTLTPGNAQVAASWSAVAGATGYNLKYSTTSGGPFTTLNILGTSANVTGLANGTLYYFVVSALSANGEGPNAAQISATPSAPLPPSAPTGLTLTPGNTQAAAAWSAVAGATSYNLKYSTTSGGPFTTLNILGTSANVTGLTNGTLYYFVVSALNANGEGANSAQSSATPAGVQATLLDYSAGFASAGPTLQLNGNAQITTGSLILTNNAPSQISSVYAKTQQNVAGFTTQFDFQTTGSWPLGDGFTFVIQRTGLSAIGQGGGGLGYGASTTNGTGGIANSVAIKFDVFDNQGEGTNSTGFYANGAAPTVANSVWLGGTGFDMRSYDLSRATLTYDGTTLTVVLKDLVTGATATQKYTVNIPALIGGSTAWVGFTAASGALTASQRIANWTYSSTGSAPAPATPSGLLATPGNAQVALTWNAVAGATSYNLKYSTTSGGPYTTLNVAGTSTTLSSLANGTPYYFVVSAIGSSGESANSAPISANPVLPAPASPTGLSATPALGQIALTWNAALGATSYNLKYSATSGGPYTTINVASTSKTITGLANGTAYYFVVTALNAGGESANSTQISSTTLTPPPITPTGLSATPGNSQIALTWNAVAGATSYNLKYSTTSGGPYTTVNTAATGATLTGLTNGTPYFFVVSALNAGGESTNSPQISAAPVLPLPATPTGLGATAGNAQVTLTWNAVAGASTYTLKYSTTSGGPYTSSVASLTGTSTTLTGLTNGTPYFFIITAINSTGESPASTQATATPILPLAAPTGLASAASNTQVALSWNPVAGATSYNVKVATTSGGPYTTLATNVTALSATITSLVNNTTYYFVVSAVNATGESPNSNQTQATPLGPVLPVPVRPSDLTATAGNASVTLNWSAISGATSYNIRYGTTAGGPYTTTLTNITATSLTIPGLTNGTKYYFVASALNASGESANSAETSATPTNTLTTRIDLSTGFAAAAGSLAINGSAFIDAGLLKLTNNNYSQLSSVYAKTQQNITTFSTQFDFQVTGSWPLAEGFTFVIQRAGLTAIGQGGGGLGYGAMSTGPGISNSVAVKFDVYDNAGEGTNSTGLYVNGASPTNAGSVWLGNTGFDMRSYDVSRALITYDGTNLSVTLTDLRTGATATQKYTVNIPAAIGGNTAWIGFTASDGSIVSNQTILNWKYSSV